jgi:soluble P-type ATPase
LLEITIPEFGILKLSHLVLDYNGTLTLDGKIPPKVKEKLADLSAKLEIQVLTADTFGTAQTELSNVPCQVHIISGDGLDKQKEEYIRVLGAESVVAFGNGRNDRLMLKAARLGVAVVGREGCATDAVMAADLCIVDVADGLDLLLHPKRLEATLKC